MCVLLFTDGKHFYLSIAGTIADVVPGCLSEDELTRIYAALRGLPHPLPDWEFFKALSCFRMAGIAQVLTGLFSMM